MLDDSLHLAAVKQIERPLPNPTGGANSRVGCSGIKCAAINGNASCMIDDRESKYRRLSEALLRVRG